MASIVDDSILNAYIAKFDDCHKTMSTGKATADKKCDTGVVSNCMEKINDTGARLINYCLTRFQVEYDFEYLLVANFFTGYLLWFASYGCISATIPYKYTWGSPIGETIITYRAIEGMTIKMLYDKFQNQKAQVVTLFLDYLNTHLIKMYFSTVLPLDDFLKIIKEERSFGGILDKLYSLALKKAKAPIPNKEAIQQWIFDGLNDLGRSKYRSSGYGFLYNANASNMFSVMFMNNDLTETYPNVLSFNCISMSIIELYIGQTILKMRPDQLLLNIESDSTTRVTWANLPDSFATGTHWCVTIGGRDLRSGKTNIGSIDITDKDFIPGLFKQMLAYYDKLMLINCKVRYPDNYEVYTSQMKKLYEKIGVGFNFYLKEYIPFFHQILTETANFYGSKYKLLSEEYISLMKIYSDPECSKGIKILVGNTVVAIGLGQDFNRFSEGFIHGASDLISNAISKRIKSGGTVVTHTLSSEIVKSAINYADLTLLNQALVKKFFGMKIGLEINDSLRSRLEGMTIDKINYVTLSENANKMGAWIQTLNFNITGENIKLAEDVMKYTEKKQFEINKLADLFNKKDVKDVDKGVGIMFKDEYGDIAEEYLGREIKRKIRESNKPETVFLDFYMKLIDDGISVKVRELKDRRGDGFKGVDGMVSDIKKSEAYLALIEKISPNNFECLTTDKAKCDLVKCEFSGDWSLGSTRKIDNVSKQFCYPKGLKTDFGTTYDNKPAIDYINEFDRFEKRKSTLGGGGKIYRFKSLEKLN
ncbi:MAG: hypothetical protein Hyperionvirus7_15 [Hyperionvirus sp.]|uniref:Uncharacterized protein n=1 Tax=Hyperionvirus sp. TaxID=2487770 RepID=A0A3G5AAB0_9VIRU|nr:MAG: hypothetical protein Hyperionvirus7_15 [Hyperionvirus sp.]